MRITVFGGSQPIPGEKPYLEALRLGRLLGEAGHVVLTGGYIGCMEAVSQGAVQAGGHVIGVTCDQIESWRPVAPNRWVMEELRFETMRQRLFALIDNCDAAMALPGGIGTLAEIAVMWSHLQTGAIPPKPLIVIGLGWKKVIETFHASLVDYVSPKDRQWISLAPDVETALHLLKDQMSGG